MAKFTIKKYLLYVKYKSNPMNTNRDISKQNNFNQKGGQTDARTDGKVNRYVSPHYLGSTTKISPRLQAGCYNLYSEISFIVKFYSMIRAIHDLVFLQLIETHILV